MFKSWPESLYGLTDAHHRQYHEFRRFRFNLKKRRNFWLQFGVWANYIILRSWTVVKSPNRTFLICTNYHSVVSNKNLLSSLVQNSETVHKQQNKQQFSEKKSSVDLVALNCIWMVVPLAFLNKSTTKNVLCEFLAKILLEFGMPAALT